MSKNSNLFSLFSAFNNAYAINRRVFTVFYSRIVFLFLKELQYHGFIISFHINPYKSSEIIVYPRYISGKPAFRKIISVSKVSRRVYVKFNTFKYEMNKDGVFFLSTSNGSIISNMSLLNNNLFSIGGELVAKIVF